MPRIPQVGTQLLPKIHLTREQVLNTHLHCRRIRDPFEDDDDVFQPSVRCERPTDIVVVAGYQQIVRKGQGPRTLKSRIHTHFATKQCPRQPRSFYLAV